MSGLQPFIDKFSTKLKSVPVKNISIEKYPVDYLRWLINNHYYYIHIYVHVLQKVLENTRLRKEDIILIDYGAGNGLLGLFAKFCGFKEVYLVDISPPFLTAARNLAANMEIAVEGILEGDITALQDFFVGKQRPHAIAGTDVIEHIYDLGHFFATIKNMNTDIITVFTTGSVTANPVKTHHLKKLQYRDEYIDSNPEHSQQGNQYAGISFLEIRRRMIFKQYPQLNISQAESLARLTRGLVRRDIMKAVDLFLQNGTMPVLLTHSTNTVDPVTGSWTERLLTTKEYHVIYTGAGFSLKIYNGFYNQWKRGMKPLFLKVVNKSIGILQKKGRWMVPFITLVGKGTKHHIPE